MEKDIDTDNCNLIDRLRNDSMTLLRGKLAQKYAGKEERKNSQKKICGRNQRNFLMNIL